MSSRFTYDVDPVYGDRRLPARFWAKVIVDKASGCWTWTGSKSKGYGRFSIGTRQAQKLVQAHRHLFEVLVGPVGQLEVDHLCRNRACVNPAHLEPVTHRENSLRGNGSPARNAAKTHCKLGHAFDDNNTRWLFLDGHEPRRACVVCLRAHYRKADIKRGKIKAA